MRESNSLLQFFVILQYFESESLNFTVPTEFCRTSVESHLLHVDVRGNVGLDTGVCLFVCLFVSMAVRGKPRMYCSLLPYCTARFGRTNFGHQSPPPLPTRYAL
jgi:hypothetical protein